MHKPVNIQSNTILMLHRSMLDQTTGYISNASWIHVPYLTIQHAPNISRLISVVLDITK